MRLKTKQGACILIWHPEKKDAMIEKVMRKGNLRDWREVCQNLEYWLSRLPGERVEAVELLRRQRDGSAARLQRVARVVRRP